MIIPVLVCLAALVIVARIHSSYILMWFGVDLISIALVGAVLLLIGSLVYWAWNFGSFFPPFAERP